MKHLTRIIILIFTTTLFLTASLSARKRAVRINLGTLAPRGTAYHQQLEVLRDRWKEESEGEVKLVIYPDGTQGGEADMVRLMRIDMLQAGLFTTVGLSDLEKDVTALQNMPMMFHTLDEFDFVRAKLEPRLEAKFKAKGYIILFWMDSGYLRFFSKEPLITPEDFKKSKFFVWAGETFQMRILKKLGYNPIPLESTDILTGLQTNMINALPAPPFFALAGQFDAQAPNMLELNWVPLVGAAVISEKAYLSIPDEYRKDLMEAAAEVGTSLREISRQANENAVAAMVSRGLTVHKLDAATEKAWINLVEGAYPEIRGNMVPADLFDEVVQELKIYRQDSVKKAN